MEIANISWQNTALLRKVVFGTVAGAVNVRRGAAAQYNIIKGGGSWHPWRYGGPTARYPNSGRSEGLVQRINKTGIHPNGGEQCSSQNRDSYVELEPSKPAEAPVYHPANRPVLKPIRSQMMPKHSRAGAAEHSLQVVADELKKSLSQKFQNWKVEIQPKPPLYSEPCSKTSTCVTITVI